LSDRGLELTVANGREKILGKMVLLDE
jgi:hypothetical protein